MERYKEGQCESELHQYQDLRPTVKKSEEGVSDAIDFAYVVVRTAAVFSPNLITNLILRVKMPPRKGFTSTMA